MSYSEKCDIQAFDADGTWTKPDGAKLVKIICAGGGGGGGSGRRGASLSDRFGGNGGGGGYTTSLLVPADFLNSTEDIVIGLGGGGATGQTADNKDGITGSAGGTTYFGGDLITNAWLCARGGVGGLGGSFKNGSMPFTHNIQSQFFVSQSGDNGVGLGIVGDSLQGAYGGGAGGPGGAIDKTDAEYTGGYGAGGSTLAFFSRATTGVTKGGNPKENGTNGDVGDLIGWKIFGNGGGGAGSWQAASGVVGVGGDGGAPSGGGGGGGASLNGNDSGAGGNGANGCCVVVTYL